MIHRWTTLGLLLFAGLIGCQSETPASRQTAKAGPAATSKPPVEVTLALNWYPEAEHGGYYAALVHKFYEEEGLDVKIRPGGPGVPVIADVAAGKVEFAVDNADKLLLLRAQEADVVAVMSPIQNSPRCILVHKKTGLARLEDLATKKDFTLAINQGQPFSQFMMKKLNLTDLRVVPYSGGIATFLEETDFGQQAYSFSEPFLVEKRGADPQCLLLSDIGFNTYTSVLITRSELIEKQSELVAKMTRASIRGWKKYLESPEQTNQHIHQQNVEMGLDVLDYGAKALKSLCLPDGFEESRFGEMSLERWQTLVSQLIEIGQIKSDIVKPSAGFTLKFLPSH